MESKRIKYCEAVTLVKLSRHLARWQLTITDTPPLEIDTALSAIDIICWVEDPSRLFDPSGAPFRNGPVSDVSVDGPRTSHCDKMHRWLFEILASAVPVADQVAVRHFLVEESLLSLGGEALRECLEAREGRRHQN
ncbi:DUF4269 domain-containing protein [Ensifer canadensis]